MKVTINQQRKVDKRSLLADITEAYERDNNVKPRYLARLLNCDLNHVRIVITNIKYKKLKRYLSRITFRCLLHVKQGIQIATGGTT